MIGGIVLETIDLPARRRVWISVREGTRAIGFYLERSAEARSISEGDTVWLQGVWALWTPAGRYFCDRQIRRIGASGVPRPGARGPRLYSDRELEELEESA